MHGVNAAPLSGGALEHSPDRSFQAGVSVGGHQADLVEVAVLQRPEELGP